MPKIIMLICFLFLSSPVMANSSQKDLVNQFWTAVVGQDLKTVSQLLDDPSKSKYFSKETGLDVSALSNFTIQAIDNGTRLDINRAADCWTVLSFNVSIKNIDGAIKIAANDTYRALMKAAMSSKKTKKYCHKFLDQPLQGTLDGKPWQYHHMDKIEYDFGTRKVTKIKLASEVCEPGCYQIKTPQVSLNFNLDSEGGNFSFSSDNITIYTPPSKNVVITEGSFRITTVDGKKKVEISFDNEKGNQLNGYFFMD